MARGDVELGSGGARGGAGVAPPSGPAGAKDGSINRVAAFWMLVLTGWTSSVSLLTVASKGEDGNYEYSPKALVFLTEVTKMVISAYWFARDVRAGRATVTLRAQSFAIYALPALIYFVQNNLLFVALALTSAPAYQILGNMRILTTGVLFRFVLGRELGKHQWTALVLLALGVVACQYDPNSASEDETQRLSVSLPGFLVILLICTCSAAAGVVNEFGMKRYSEDSIHLQNMQVYACGMVFNFINWARDERSFSRGLLYGFSGTSYTLLLVISCAGLLVSYILKNYHVIIKVIATSMSLPVTAIASNYLFGTPVNVFLLLGIVMVGGAVLLYSSKSFDDFLAQYRLGGIAAAAGYRGPAASRASSAGYRQVAAVGPLDLDEDLEDDGL